jgi:phosphatidylglycerol:prolipoprotein diacylglycerol transferase
MITINVNPIAFTIGTLSVHWYGIMYVVGITIGLLVAWPYARSKGITSEQLETVAAFSIPAGLIGARLYYVVQQPLGPFLSQPWRILAFQEGGMAFYGAIFAVLLVLIISAWRMRFSLWKLLDVGAIFAAVGQFFGRIGNIINGDIIGYATHLPWGFIYANPNSFPPSHTIAYQPAAVYEAIIDIIIFTTLWVLRNKYRPGVLFFTYIFLYSISQFLIFFVRDNVVVFWGLKQAQITALIVMLVAAVIFVWFLRTKQGKEPTPSDNSGNSGLGGTPSP